LGMSELFDIIIQDLKDIEQIGIEISYKNEKIILKGTLVALIGDNLGSHFIGGFNENFNMSGYFCRFCHINKIKENSQLITSKFKKRTVETYKEDINNIVNDNQASRGIKSNSVFNNLNFFHVCQPGLPPCISHDLFEGIVQYDVMLIINELVVKRVLTYEYINDKLSNIYFQNEEKIYLPSIKKSEKLNGTHSQNMKLLNILPFALIRLNNLYDFEEWKLLLLLRKIVNIAIAFKISIGQIALLHYLIEEYLEAHQKLFPSKKLKPKHHYLIHYSNLLREFGPLRHLWTLAFEHKHQYFKNVVRHTTNYKNILFSLSRKHQLLQAYNSSLNSLYYNKIISEDARLLEQNIVFQEINKVHKIHENQYYFSFSASFKGIIYKKKSFVSYGVDTFGYYNLCQIEYLVIDVEFENLYFFEFNTARFVILLINVSYLIFKIMIFSASKKLGINGSNLVLESDGTLITEDEVLLLMKTETLILLEKDQVFDKILDSCVISRPIENNILNIADIPFIESDLNITTNYDREKNIVDNLNEEQAKSAIIQVINVHEEDFNWIDYKIPWNKVPIDMLKTCEEGIRSKSIITEIYEDGHILGDGSCTMFHKLRERCLYMKRIESKQSAEKSGTIQTKKRKFHVMAGCSNYQDLPSSSTSINATDIVEETHDEKSFEDMMETCYIQQRKFLENFEQPPSLNDIKKEFPILFKLESVIFHFNKLTGKRLDDLPEIMKEKSTKIVEFAIQNKYLHLNNNEDYCIQSLRFFALYFKEDFGKMYYKVEVKICRFIYFEIFITINLYRAIYT
ncbi:hypothetical protein ALC62_00173, partial [Cyphomyrmex costatus]